MRPQYTSPTTTSLPATALEPEIPGAWVSHIPAAIEAASISILLIPAAYYSI